MFKQKAAVIAILGGLSGLFYPQITRADGYTSAKLLAESPQGQKSFIEISIAMAGSIATQANPRIAKCLDGWYFGAPSKQPERKAHILSVMRQYPNYHPSGVILAVLQKACGSFKP